MTTASVICVIHWVSVHRARPVATCQGVCTSNGQGILQCQGTGNQCPGSCNGGICTNGYCQPGNCGPIPNSVQVTFNSLPYPAVPNFTSNGGLTDIQTPVINFHAYCDRSANIWRARVTRLYIEIDLSANWPVSADVTNSIIGQQNSCSVLRKMRTDLNSGRCSPGDAYSLDWYTKDAYLSMKPCMLRVSNTSGGESPVPSSH